MNSLIIFLPLFSSIFTGFYGYRCGTKGSVIITIFSLGSAALLSVYSLVLFSKTLIPFYIFLGKWVSVGSFFAVWSLTFDSLALIMFALVTTISTLVYFYTVVYLLEDPHLIRFSCYISLFTFFMLIFIASDNLLQIFFGWEGVGLCSYLLINFWYTRLQANKAAIQAIMVNKIGDIALLLAIAAIFYMYQSVDLSTLFLLTPYLAPTNTFSFLGKTLLSLPFITFLLFIGAVGKSAQIGLHTWLPSAMEGPTPVSALIHAATMVTAGIFLIIRCSFLFEYTNSVLILLTLIGSLTSFFAATAGLLQNDLKRVIAYSTCSQLGYMAFACGLSNYSTAFFHLVNHGFFKALLFLSAGSIIHGFSDEQDLRKMGSLRKLFPITYCSFFIGSLALMGFPYLAGFFSKDIILEVAYSRYTIISVFAYWLGTLSAMFTAFYSFRILFLTFFAPTNSFKPSMLQSHESTGLIVLVLFFLSIGSIFSGFILKEFFIGFGSTFLGNSLFILPSHFNLLESEFLPISVKLIPLIFSLSGAFLALLLNHHYSNFLFFLKKTLVGKLVYTFLNQKWFFEKIYNLLIIKPFFHYSYFLPFLVLDKGFIEFFGPRGLVINLNLISHKWSNFHTGLIYHYTFWLVLSLFMYINFFWFFTLFADWFSVEILIYYFLILFSVLI